MIKAEVVYSGKMTTNWDQCRKRIAPRIQRGIRAGADVLLQAANKLCPKDTRALVDSGTVRRVKGGLESEYIVGYGSVLFTAVAYGPARAKRPPHVYAVYVHETGIRFLEIACLEQRSQIVEAINQQIFA